LLSARVVEICGVHDDNVHDMTHDWIRATIKHRETKDWKNKTSKTVPVRVKGKAWFSDVTRCSGRLSGGSRSTQILPDRSLSISWIFNIQSLLRDFTLDITTNDISRAMSTLIWNITRYAQDDKRTWSFQPVFTLCYSTVATVGCSNFLPFAIYCAGGAAYPKKKTIAGRYASAYGAGNDKLESVKVILAKHIFIALFSPLSSAYARRCWTALCKAIHCLYSTHNFKRTLNPPKIFLSASNCVCNGRSTISHSRRDNACDSAKGHDRACAEAQWIFKAGE